MNSEQDKESLKDEQPIQKQPEEQPRFFLFKTNIPIWKYILCATVISLVPSLIISAILHFSGLVAQEDWPKLDSSFGPLVIFLGIVLLSPIVETLIMAFMLWVLSLITKRKIVLAIICCIIWAGLHSLVASAWGLTVCWPFFVFSCVFLAWREKSWWKAVFITGCIHMLHNLVPGILIVAVV